MNNFKKINGKMQISRNQRSIFNYPGLLRDWIIGQKPKEKGTTERGTDDTDLDFIDKVVK